MILLMDLATALISQILVRPVYQILITSGLSRRLSFPKDEERLLSRSLAMLHEILHEGIWILNIPNPAVH